LNIIGNGNDPAAPTVPKAVQSAALEGIRQL
jgi:hypothetical protein